MPRSKSALWRLIALFAVLSLVFAACGDDDDEETTTGDDTEETTEGSGEAVKIAFVGPLTGDAANLGVNIRNGIKVAIEEATDVEVELVEYDTQGDPAQATTLKDEFIADEDIIGIVGPTFSGETKAILPALDEAGLVMVSASATNAQLPEVVPDSAVFHRLIPDDDVQGTGLTGYITKKLGAKKMAYIHDNSEYGKGLTEGTQKLVEAEGVSTAIIEAVDPKSQDFSAAVNKVKAAAPDVIFYGGYYAEAGRMRKQLVDAGVDATFISGDGSLDPGFIESGGAGAEGAQLTCPCNLATEESPEPLGSFAKKYKEVNGADPGTYSTEGYDSAKILIEGIREGNTTREKLLEYVEGIDAFEGISKEISFEENGNIKATDVFVFEVKGGKIVLLGKSSELVS